MDVSRQYIRSNSGFCTRNFNRGEVASLVRNGGMLTWNGDNAHYLISLSQEPVMIFGDEDSTEIKIVNELRYDQCNFWDSAYPQYV